MIAMLDEPAARHDIIRPGPRYALDACALSHGMMHGPILLVSGAPAWERELRMEIDEQLFALDEPERPVGQAWVGAVWVEPQWRTWQADLQRITELLPHGALLSVVLSLPLARIKAEVPRGALGTHLSGLLRLRSALHLCGYRVERAFGFQTIWSLALRWIAFRIRVPRPDLSDRVQYAVRRSFATRRYLMPFATIGLIEARAGMRP